MESIDWTCSVSRCVNSTHLLRYLQYPVICRIIKNSREGIMGQTAHNQLYSEEKAVRLEARLSRVQKGLLQHAADLSGRSLTDFIVTASQEAANKVIREHEILTLTMKESENFVHALLNPLKPNTALKNAAKRYKKFQGKKRS